MILAGEEQKNLRQRIVRGLSRLQDVNPQSSDELFLLANPACGNKFAESEPAFVNIENERELNHPQSVQSDPLKVYECREKTQNNWKTTFCFELQFSSILLFFHFIGEIFLFSIRRMTAWGRPDNSINFPSFFPDRSFTSTHYACPSPGSSTLKFYLFCFRSINYALCGVRLKRSSG
jgi:hypothetical protein